MITPLNSPLAETERGMEQYCSVTRHTLERTLIMRVGYLKNGREVKYIYKEEFGIPHFTYFSHDISETGYRSDFFGSHGQKLSEAKILEAFEIRANMLAEKHKKENPRHDQLTLI